MWLRPHRVLYLVGLLRLYRSTCPQYSRLKLTTLVTTQMLNLPARMLCQHSLMGLTLKR